MTIDELKKKIIETIAPYVSAWGDDERIADALIEAGMTFHLGDENENLHKRSEKSIELPLFQQSG